MGALSLCTGVGSLDAAVTALTGVHMEFCAETDEAAAAVLAARFPEVVNLGDITVVDWAAFAAFCIAAWSHLIRRAKKAKAVR